jgi:hypothetical protein
MYDARTRATAEVALDPPLKRMLMERIGRLKDTDSCDRIVVKSRGLKARVVGRLSSRKTKKDGIYTSL